ncbi:unnamed protein product [Prunus brigantina]
MESKIVKEPRTVPTMRHSSPISNSEERDLVNIFACLSRFESSCSRCSLEGRLHP